MTRESWCNFANPECSWRIFSLTPDRPEQSKDRWAKYVEELRFYSLLKGKGVKNTLSDILRKDFLLVAFQLERFGEIINVDNNRLSKMSAMVRNRAKKNPLASEVSRLLFIIHQSQADECEIQDLSLCTYVSWNTHWHGRFVQNMIRLPNTTRRCRIEWCRIWFAGWFFHARKYFGFVFILSRFFSDET